MFLNRFRKQKMSTMTWSMQWSNHLRFQRKCKALNTTRSWRTIRAIKVQESQRLKKKSKRSLPNYLIRKQKNLSIGSFLKNQHQNDITQISQTLSDPHSNTCKRNLLSQTILWRPKSRQHKATFHCLRIKWRMINLILLLSWLNG